MWDRVVVALAAVVVLTAARPAAAETVRSYAYVTAASGIAKTHKSQSIQCWVTIQLPATPVAQPPANDDLTLLAKATRVGVTVSDPYDNCTDYIHTWQLATFDPEHRDHVKLDWPAGKPSVVIVILAGVLVILVGGYGLNRLRTRRSRDQRTVQRA